MNNPLYSEINGYNCDCDCDCDHHLLDRDQKECNFLGTKFVPIWAPEDEYSLINRNIECSSLQLSELKKKFSETEKEINILKNINQFIPQELELLSFYIIVEKKLKEEKVRIYEQLLGEIKRIFELKIKKNIYIETYQEPIFVPAKKHC